MLNPRKGNQITEDVSNSNGSVEEPFTSSQPSRRSSRRKPSPICGFDTEVDQKKFIAMKQVLQDKNSVQGKEATRPPTVGQDLSTSMSSLQFIQVDIPHLASSKEYVASTSRDNGQFMTPDAPPSTDPLQFTPPAISSLAEPELFESHNCVPSDPISLEEEDEIRTFQTPLTERMSVKVKSIDTLLAGGTPRPRKPVKKLQDISNVYINVNALKSAVKRLESISDKLAAASLLDSYDQFGKYISSLLRGLPSKEVNSLKQKIISEVMSVVNKKIVFRESQDQGLGGNSNQLQLNRLTASGNVTTYSGATSTIPVKPPTIVNLRTYSGAKPTIPINQPTVVSSASYTNALPTPPEVSSASSTNPLPTLPEVSSASSTNPLPTLPEVSSASSTNPLPILPEVSSASSTNPLPILPEVSSASPTNPLPPTLPEVSSASPTNSFRPKEQTCAPSSASNAIKFTRYENDPHIKLQGTKRKGEAAMCSDKKKLLSETTKQANLPPAYPDTSFADGSFGNDQPSELHEINSQDDFDIDIEETKVFTSDQQHFFESVLCDTGYDANMKEEPPDPELTPIADTLTPAAPIALVIARRRVCVVDPDVCSSREDFNVHPSSAHSGGSKPMSGKPGIQPGTARLVERHFIEYIPRTGKKLRPSRKCVICSKLGFRRETAFWCPDCQAALCVVNCFKNYHTQLNL